MKKLKEYKIIISQDGQTINGYVSADTVQDGKASGINVINEIENALRDAIVTDLKLLYAKDNNLPTHYDDDFDISELTKDELELYNNLFLTDDIINDNTNVEIEEIYHENEK